MADRYDRNKSSINHEDQEKLKTFCVAVVGLGGLGGYIADQLARVGVGKLILIDGDVFDVRDRAVWGHDGFLSVRLFKIVGVSEVAGLMT